MKSPFFVQIVFSLAAACLAANVSRAGDPDTAGAASVSLPSSVSPTPSSQDKVFVRGWEIQAVLGARRSAVKQVFPNYQQGKRSGDVAGPAKTTKGRYLLVLVRCKSATLQVLDQPLWTGKPDVVLIDETGTEYPAVGSLTQQAGEYVTFGMASGATRKQARPAPATTCNSLVFFDVPPSAQRFWLRFSKTGPSVLVSELKDLPAISSGGS